MSDREALAQIIWTASRNDEGTISAAGANIVADAVLASAWFADRRKATARAWSAYLELALDDKLDDGTPVVELALALNPELRARLCEALS